MIVPGMFVCSSFLISVCRFIVAKVLLISSATVIVRAWRSIWLKPFATVLFRHCRVLWFAPVLRGCVWFVCCYVSKNTLLQFFFAITERRDMGLYEVPLSMSLFGFGMGTMLANFYV